MYVCQSVRSESSEEEEEIGRRERGGKSRKRQKHVV